MIVNPPVSFVHPASDPSPQGDVKSIRSKVGGEMAWSVLIGGCQKPNNRFIFIIIPEEDPITMVHIPKSPMWLLALQRGQWGEKTENIHCFSHSGRTQCNYVSWWEPEHETLDFGLTLSNRKTLVSVLESLKNPPFCWQVVPFRNGQIYHISPQKISPRLIYICVQYIYIYTMYKDIICVYTSTYIYIICSRPPGGNPTHPRNV